MIRAPSAKKKWEDVPVSRSVLPRALHASALEVQKVLSEVQQTREEASKTLQPFLDKSLESLQAQEEFLKSEHVTVVDARAARELRRAPWANNYCQGMEWRPGNLSKLAARLSRKGQLPPLHQLVSSCLEVLQEAEALEDEHRRVMQEAQQLAYEMARVDVMLKRMQWLDQNRHWWTRFKASAQSRFRVNLVEHTMDGVRAIFWRIEEKERWVLTKFLSCYLPYAREWEAGWPQHQGVVSRAQALMDRLGAALRRYVEIDWRFKAADARVVDECGLSLPHKNWTAVHDQALQDLTVASSLAGTDTGRCDELRLVEDSLTVRPVMAAPKRMWKKDPELYSPEDRPRFSFLLQHRGQADRVKDMHQRLYRCTGGMLGRGGSLPEGWKSEMLVNMLDPYRTMWDWILAWVATDRGRFVVPVLPQLAPDNAGINDLAFMARGDLLIVLASDEPPPEACDWLRAVSDVFDSWPALGLVGFHTTDPSTIFPHLSTTSTISPPLPRNSKAAEVAHEWYTHDSILSQARSSDPGGPLKDPQSEPQDPAGVQQGTGKQDSEADKEGATGALRDPKSEVPMHFTGMVNPAGPLVMRRSVFLLLGGMDEVDDREGDRAVLGDLRLCSRVWLSGHQVAKIDLAQGEASPFFTGNQARVANKDNADKGEQDDYGVYDDFFVQFNEVIKAEVSRLNALLQRSGLGITKRGKSVGET